MENTILTKKKFAVLVENNVLEFKMTYMDAILKICTDREIDPGDINKLVSPVIKDKLQAECVVLRLVDGDDNSSQLPV